MTEVPAPRSNALLLGQEEAEGRFVAALSSGRLPHAWLLTGKSGIGKAARAYRVARFLLARPDGRPGLDGSLAIDTAEPTFRQIAGGAHPDLMVLVVGVFGILERELPPGDAVDGVLPPQDDDHLVGSRTIQNAIAWGCTWC